MDDNLNKAIRNNNGLYEAIFSQQNLSFESTANAWYSVDKVPPLYSNIVTRTAEWKPDQIFKMVERAAEKGRWDGWSIKDSFAVLNLSDYGFRRLLNAQWTYLKTELFVLHKRRLPLKYKILANEDELSDWRQAWDDNEQLGKEIFWAGLLRDPNVKFIAGYYENQLVSGCMLNKTDDVSGISNFFSPGDEIVYWSDLISFILGSQEQADIAGYERIELVDKLRPLGFKPIGNLTVWIRNINP